ncbi:MAG: NUDIX domain-containing protein [Candidatus Staskawiczbacteria bacterium]|jgi:8-oxo-dGTP diphosphatase
MEKKSRQEQEESVESENKRRVSDLIPYRIKGDKVFVFLQKREAEPHGAANWPEYLGFFGGHAEENETPEQALKREIKEELNLDLKEFEHFGTYEIDGTTEDVFVTEVADGFDYDIKVGEGQYGDWFSEQDIASELKVIPQDMLVLQKFFEFLHGKNKL